MDRHALKIDFLFPPQDPTGELSFHTQALGEAMTRRGTHVRILKPQRLDFRSFYQDIKNHKPDYTLSFNGILPSEKGLFLCDILQIPHIAILTDYPPYFVQLVQSPLNCLFAQDQASVRFLNGTGAKDAHFLPAAIDKKIVPPLEKLNNEKLNTVPIFCWLSSPSSKSIVAEWKDKYSKETIDIIVRAKDFALFDPKQDLSEALSYSLQSAPSPEQIKLEELEPLLLLLELEKYLASSAIESLLASLKGLPLTIMAQKEIPSDLPELFPEFTHIDEGDIDQFFTWLGKSKTVLIPDFVLKESIPFKLLAAMATDVLPICFKTQYLSEEFGEHDFLSFTKSELPSLKGKIQGVLGNYEKQEAILHKNREHVARKHTWDTRAEELLSILSAKAHK